eukprot:6186383-Pleurochrysis_carterae.AAC.5
MKTEYFQLRTRYQLNATAMFTGPFNSNIAHELIWISVSYGRRQPSLALYPPSAEVVVVKYPYAGTHGSCSSRNFTLDEGGAKPKSAVTAKLRKNSAQDPPMHIPQCTVEVFDVHSQHTHTVLSIAQYIDSLTHPGILEKALHA